MSAVAVTYMTDPGCPWAYSINPAVSVLRWRYGDQLDWRVVTIGLTEHASEYDARGLTPERVAAGRLGFRRFGMPFTPEPRQRNVATGRACRAIVATRLRHPGRELAVLRALQFGWMTTTLPLDEDDGIRAAIDGVAAIDADAVIAAIDEADGAYEADRALARSASGSPTEAMGRAAVRDGVVRYTAPSLLFDADGRRLDAGGFQNLEVYDACLANLDPRLERRPPAADAREAIVAFPDGLTTQEVAAVMTARLDPVDRSAAERSLIAAAAEGSVVRTPLGDDALWRAA